MAGGRGERRQHGLAELDVDVGPLGDPQRVVARLGHLGEQRAHLGRGLQVELLGVELEPVGVVAGRPRLHAQQRVVRLGVVAVDVVAVVGGQQRRPDVLGDLDQLGVRLVLLGEAVVLQFDEEVVLPEDLLEPGGGLGGAGDVALEEPLADEPAQAAAGGDQALAVRFEELEVEPGLVEEPVEVGGRGDLDEVLVALGRLRQQREVEDLVVGPAGAVVAGAGDEVPLHPDDGPDPRLLGRSVEVEDAVHVPVVGDADGRLAVGGGGGHHVVDPRRAVEHRELGVEVKVDEVAHLVFE